MGANQSTFFGDYLALESLTQAGSSEEQIGEALGRHRTTIGRELKRNARANGAKYDYQGADQMAAQRRRLARQPYRFDAELAETVITLLEQGFSPKSFLACPFYNTFYNTLL